MEFKQDLSKCKEAWVTTENVDAETQTEVTRKCDPTSLRLRRRLIRAKVEEILILRCQNFD